MICSICEGALGSMGHVPFDRNDFGVPLVDTTPMEYFRCSKCLFICCPEMLSWTAAELGTKVYNEDYIKFDPSYLDERPRAWGQVLLDSVPAQHLKNIIHLDYGSGQGTMVSLLKPFKWNSTCYDPYSSPVKPAGIFNLITAVEVFEHALNIDETLLDIKSMLSRTGVILFTTLLSTGKEDIDWWYIAPRNGHISILSVESLKVLAKKHGLFFDSIDTNLHVLQSARSNIKNILGLDLSRKNKQ